MSFPISPIAGQIHNNYIYNSTKVTWDKKSNTEISFNYYRPTPSVTSGNIVKYTSKRNDSHSAYNSSTGLFTVPVAGFYNFSFNALMAVDGDHARLLFEINGTDDTKFGETLVGGEALAWEGHAYVSIGMSMGFDLSKDDTIGVKNSGTCLTWSDSNYGAFSGYLVN